MKSRTISEIRILLESKDNELEPTILAELQKDTRKGVQKLLIQWDKQKRQEQMLAEQYIRMSTYEQRYKEAGYHLIAGVDEVGRGPLAGPVVASAVILDPNETILGLNDSKALTAAKRQQLHDEIVKKALAVGVGVVESEEIDRINIYEASKRAMILAIEDLPVQPDCLLIDAMKLPVEIQQESIIKGDAASNSIAAASIIAKVTRDRIMEEYAELYPHYSFATNAGYGTKEHLEAIRQHGITPIHRKSFAPVSDHIKQSEKV